MAIAVGATLLIGSPALTHNASAQPLPPGSPGPSKLVPVVIGAAAGATVGALLWPVIMPAAMVAPAAGAVAIAPEAAGWGWGAFITTRAAIGALIGAGLGYVAGR